MLTIDGLYKRAISLGIEADPRGKKDVNAQLVQLKKDYEELKPEQKEEFDLEKLTNPYADTRILCGNKDKGVKEIMIGIDIDVAEILVADRLIERGKQISLVISHHPSGYAWAGFYDVMRMQADILYKYGVPINVAEGILKERISEVERKIMPANHNRAVDIAKLFNIPFVCIHTPVDNLVTAFLQKKMDEENPYRLKDVIKLLKEIPEYKEAITNNAGPKILVGVPENRAGKIFVEMTGGTEGSKLALEKLSHAGVGTIIGMHMSDELRKEAENNHINVIIAGHIASDTLGLNCLLDELVEETDLTITECSGFRRISHK